LSQKFQFQLRLQLNENSHFNYEFRLQLPGTEISVDSGLVLFKKQ